MPLPTLSATEVAFVMLAVLQGVLAALWALGGWRFTDARRAAWHWAAYAGASALMLALLLLALRASEPRQAAALRLAGSVLGVLALLALQRGIGAFIGRDTGWRGQALALAAVLVASAIALDPTRGALRAGAEAAVLAVLCLAMAHALYRHAREALHLRWPAVLALPLLLGAATFAWRGLRALLEPEAVASGVATDSPLNLRMAFADLVLALAFHAALAALVVARFGAELRHRSRHDALTGLANRRALEEALAAQLQRSLRNGESFALMMIDIDHFRAINDRHGQPAGDLALKQIAAVLRQGVREIDRVARYGGEEFVVLLPDTGLVEAQPLAERLREQVARQSLAQSGLGLSLTVSIGVTEWRPGSDDVTRLLVRAGVALDRAKQGGRDRVEVARAEPPAPQAAPRAA